MMTKEDNNTKMRSATKSKTCLSFYFFYVPVNGIVFALPTFFFPNSNIFERCKNKEI